MSRWMWVVAAALAVAAAACGSDNGAVKPDDGAHAGKSGPAPTQKPTAGAAGDEAKKPAEGINAKFVDPDMDVAQWMARFEREQREVYKHRKAIVAAMGVKAGETVADVGAGSGAFTAELAAAVGGKGKVWALDISPRFIDHLKKRVATEGLSQVEVKLSEPADVTLPAGSVDVVFACDTYHHFEEPTAILKTIKAALKPGGRLVVVDFHRIEGKSKAWLLEHVRAGQEVFAKEITDAGFVRQPDPAHGFLEENYMMVFTRP